MRIGIDTGGTFCDFAIARGRSLRVWKTPSTPDDPSRAVSRGLEQLAGTARDAILVHGTTVATNALLEHKLARVTLIADRGLEDVIEIGRQARPDLYSLEVRLPPPLVPRSRRIGIGERTHADGTVSGRMSERELDALVERVRRTRPQAIAIGLLFSFLNDRTERRVERALSRLGVPISRSSRVAPEVREYERISTTVANAALVPGVASYLERLRARLDRRGGRLFVFQSNGGMANVDRVSREPVRLLLSGPAGGAIGAARVAKRHGIDRALALDMGGTSTDVCLIEGAPLRRGEISVGGRTFLSPSLDIETVGAGGGSRLWVDHAGILRVGPESQGADPGPACYGRASEPTITDAHVVLGRLPEKLAGGVVLDPDRAHRALERLARRLGANRFRTAEAALGIADATMARAARRVAVQRGRDPRSATLIAFGGAGPLHAARLVDALPAQEALVPTAPGNLSAWGMALADAERDLVRSVLIRDPDRHRARLEKALAELREEGIDAVQRDGLVGGEPSRIRVFEALDCRYAGQSFTLEIPNARSVKAAFDRAHRRRFGHALPDRTVEVVNARIRVAVPTQGPPRRNRAPTGAEAPPAAEARLPPRSVWFGGRFQKVPSFDRERLGPRERLDGPAIVLESGSTTVIEPGFSAIVAGDGSLWIRRGR